MATDDLGGGLVQHHRLGLLGCAEPQRVARNLVHRALENRASTEQIDDAAVVASELVTNALRHTASGPVRMDLDVYEDTAVLWVYDGEPHADPLSAEVPSSADELLEGGRGLYLVEALTARWFVWPARPGKAVVAVMPVGGGRPTRTA
ncbi:ATP-binding protein [Actinacidiphila bryophytorum]|uniref:ATP-binding protein n=1 Tax=Actinacidiphila bryophytorum TaxID=1436133 RepID=UPI00195F8F84|nr:ATP-binding protein [Actinacidiphila bryophytorum]MBM9437242.1 ATP-binding protein [Actinacidiphila bryophytorum]MBN6541762.1 ATP-binding protein [Actinacidiphila bryophytorum]